MSRYSSILSSRVRVEPSRSLSGDERMVADGVLFARFLDGDDGAFMEFFSRHSPRLHLYCLKFVGDRSRARDIMQDLWERVIRYRSEGKPLPQSPLGFVLRMAHNLCLNDIRYNRRREHDSLEALPEWRYPGTPRQEMSELEEAVVIALDQLPDGQREILIMNAYAGYRFDEIADMLGEPAGAVRMRAWRARAKLGDIITAMTGLREEDEREQRNDDDEDERQPEVNE